MNKRILELWEQSADKFPHGIKTNPERFAELIIRECSKVIVNGGYRNPAFGEKHSLRPPEIAKMIEEHFGVK